MGIEPTWLAWKARALPLSYTRTFIKMVGAAGFEPATPWSQARCSTKLSHAPNDKINYISFLFYRQLLFVKFLLKTHQMIT